MWDHSWDECKLIFQRRNSKSEKGPSLLERYVSDVGNKPAWYWCSGRHKAVRNRSKQQVEDLSWPTVLWSSVISKQSDMMKWSCRFAFGSALKFCLILLSKMKCILHTDGKAQQWREVLLLIFHFLEHFYDIQSQFYDCLKTVMSNRKSRHTTQGAVKLRLS